MKRLIATLFLVVALYLLLLNPAFTFMGGRHSLMLLWPLVLLLCNKKYRRGITLQKGFFVMWSFMLIYIIIRTLLGGDIQYLINQILLLIDVLIAFVLIRFASINNIDFVKSLLIMACIAGTISCVCLFVPSFNSFTKDIQVITNEAILKATHRGFGIGEGLTFTYGVVLGSICALGICLYNKYRWYVLFAPIVSGAVIINARSGLIPILIASFFVLLSERNIKFYAYIAGVVILFAFVWVTYLESIIPPEVLNWALIFFEELGEGSEGATAEVLLNSEVWPNDMFEWIFGKGINIFDPIRGKRSDVGYFIELCYGGIIYCFILILLILNLIKTAYKRMPALCYWTFVTSLFFLNLKSEYVSRNMAFTFFVLIMFYYSQIHRKKEPTLKSLAKI